LKALTVDSQFVLLKCKLFEDLTVDIFLSKFCCETFVRFVVAQLRKARGLNKKIVQPVARQRKEVVDFCGAKAHGGI